LYFLYFYIQIQGLIQGIQLFKMETEALKPDDNHGNPAAIA
jgi:FtsZ-binding cell division protein ZapB